MARHGGLRLTRVGWWFLIFAAIVAISASNTGNNGLYLVLAVMGGALVVSWIMARFNLSGLEASLEPPSEAFANHPVHLRLELRNTSRWAGRWWLLAGVAPGDLEGPAFEKSAKPSRQRGSQVLVSRLAPGAAEHGFLELFVRRRGRRRLRAIHAFSLFPLGFFRGGTRCPVETEFLVYPEIFDASPLRHEEKGKAGDEPTRRIGWGHELFSLRPYRHGDDPRAIHWKQSARVGELIFTEHETEENRRLAIIFDNAVGELTGDGRRRFERLVSEAATAAIDFLDEGYEVELLTRGEYLPFGGGSRQRRRILEVLALVEPVPKVPKTLEPPQPRAAALRLGLHFQEELHREAAAP